MNKFGCCDYNSTAAIVTAVDLRSNTSLVLARFHTVQPAAVNVAQSPDLDANNSATTSGIGAGNNPETIERDGSRR